MRHLLVTDSDLIYSIGYDKLTCQMAIVFATKPTHLYMYENINPTLFVQVLMAESIGSAFHNFIKTKPQAYTCVQTPLTEELRKTLKLERKP